MVRSVLERLLEKTAINPAVHLDEWRIGELENARFREEAVELARRCDIFAIAAESLPTRLVEFTSDWLRSPPEAAALVLFAFGPRCVGDFESLGFRQLARANKVDCFSTIIEGTTGAPTIASLLMSTPPTEISALNE